MAEDAPESLKIDKSTGAATSNLEDQEEGFKREMKENAIRIFLLLNKK